MKNEVFRNHRYNFIVNGIVEREMIDLQICKTIDQSKLDWTTNHKNLKISYQLPKYENDEVKQYVYSLNFMMKCLRGAVAHKMDHNYEIIQSFNKEYPQLIDFLFMRRHLLEIKYSEMIESKNTWFKVYFSNNQIVGRIIKWLTNKQVGSPNEKVVEAHKKLNEYCTLYKNQIAKKLKEVKVKCDKCVNVAIFRTSS